MGPEKVKMVNKAIALLKSTSDDTLTYVPLDVTTIHHRVYIDASYANNDDHTSQLSHLNLLSDNTNR